MPRVRGSEMAPRVTTRNPTRTSSSESDPLHHRPVTDRSPKLADRRSPRSTHSEPLNQKKLGTRIAGLETQLEQAQGELKSLKDQLASAEAAKKEAQKELEKRNAKVSGPGSGQGQDARSSPSENRESNEIGEGGDNLDENLKETDVFEVPVEMVSVETKIKVNASPESPEKPRVEDVIAAKNKEITVLKMAVEEKDKKLDEFREENESLKRELGEANEQVSSLMVNEQKSNLRLTRVEEEFEKSKCDGVQLKEKLKEVEAAKDALETEMKRLRVQTEQWRKAADAAAAIISGGVERCGSMDKQYGGGFDGYGGFPGSPDEMDDGLKRKGSGIRMFGDLWKKKGQK
ncbi:interactor of constitutive active ROPs 4-like [Bidens hawaiensis]|uniref:interactor of constitutive active ROPs 4-like n=1 Tax=Bidens hawaiensis TaxID=980011 RepID=UPI004049E144